MLLKNIIFEANRYEKEINKIDRPNWKNQLLNYIGNRENDVKDLYFINFSDMDLGTINPYNIWGTPTGFYGYPLYDETAIDFATVRSKIIIFKATGNILDLSKYSEDDMHNDINKLNKNFENEIENYKFQKLITLNKSPGRILWDILYYLSQDLSPAGNRIVRYKSYNRKIGDPEHKEYKQSSNTWAYILRKILNYDAVYDSGASIIHVNEPHQILVLNPKSLRIIKIIDKNKETFKGSIKSLSQDIDIKDDEKYIDTNFTNNNFINSFYYNYFRNCIFKNCIFDKISNVDCSFNDCKFINCNFINFDCEFAKLENVYFYDCKLQNTRFSQAKLYTNIIFNKCDIDNIIFSKSLIEDYEFENIISDIEKEIPITNIVKFINSNFNNIRGSNKIFIDYLLKNKK